MKADNNYTHFYTTIEHALTFPTLFVEGKKKKGNHFIINIFLQRAKHFGIWNVSVVKSIQASINPLDSRRYEKRMKFKT